MTPLTTVSDDAHTLSGEHATLMRDVERRAAPVFALLATRTWPHAELGALTSFLRANVLRQVSDEEALLFPPDASAPALAELSADHVRLHVLTIRLEDVHAQPCSVGELRSLVEDLLTTLHQHLIDEQLVLAALMNTDIAVPSAAGLAAIGQRWLFSDQAAVQIRLDAFPEEKSTELCVERLLRLQRGQTAEVHALDRRSLQAVASWLHDFDAERYGLAHATAGPEYVLRVACRRADAPVGVGYPG